MSCMSLVNCDTRSNISVALFTRCHVGNPLIALNTCVDLFSNLLRSEGTSIFIQSFPICSDSIPTRSIVSSFSIFLIPCVSFSMTDPASSPFAVNLNISFKWDNIGTVTNSPSCDTYPDSSLLITSNTK